MNVMLRANISSLLPPDLRESLSSLPLEELTSLWNAAKDQTR